MGGVVPEAIPSIPDVAQMLKTLADLRLPFKATAGLHHPLRSKQPLTYHPQSPTGVMHGFINLSCAAAVAFFGGDVEEAKRLLAEEDPAAWKVSADSLRWRDQSWTAEQLATLRREFFIEHWKLLLRRTNSRLGVRLRMAVKSWVESANEPGTDFPLQNLPYGVFSP